jgi:hypothetical protein
MLLTVQVEAERLQTAAAAAAAPTAAAAAATTATTEWQAADSLSIQDASLVQAVFDLTEYRFTAPDLQGYKQLPPPRQLPRQQQEVTRQVFSVPLPPVMSYMVSSCQIHTSYAKIVHNAQCLAIEQHLRNIGCDRW